MYGCQLAGSHARKNQAYRKNELSIEGRQFEQAIAEQYVLLDDFTVAHGINELVVFICLVAHGIGWVERQEVHSTRA